MKKTNTGHIIMAACLIAAGVMIYYLYANVFKDFVFGETNDQNTVIEFNNENSVQNGFNHDVVVYTEDGITECVFTGKITIKGSAEISMISNEDDNVVYRRIYSDLDGTEISFKIDHLVPFTYYTLIFSSDNANNGRLLLTTNVSFAKRPQRDIPSKRR